MYTADGHVRPHYAVYADWLTRQPDDVLRQKRAEADSLFHRVGITFAVYGEQDGTERLIPFDIIPRILSADEWRKLAAGLRQRVRALNAFIGDVYHGQEILQAGLLPPEQVFCNPQYRPEMQGLDVPGGIYAHIAGIDVVRAGAGRVLRAGGQPARAVGRVVHARGPQDDDAAVPGAVRAATAWRRSSTTRIACSRTSRSVAPAGVADPVVVLLTPGAHNSAYFEHAFLAQQMGVELVEGQDLFVRDGFVYMRTTQRAAARRRDLPPHRRRLPRPAGVPPRLRARRARA